MQYLNVSLLSMWLGALWLGGGFKACEGQLIVFINIGDAAATSIIFLFIVNFFSLLYFHYILLIYRYLVPCRQIHRQPSQCNSLATRAVQLNVFCENAALSQCTPYTNSNASALCFASHLHVDKWNR